MRKFSSATTPATKRLLERLASKPAPEEYRKLMTNLGVELGRLLEAKLGNPKTILLICTNEDADFLAKGVLDELETHGRNNINLACFWNDRKHLGPEFDVAPIIRRFVEPTRRADIFVVVKSIIATACVVRTNISELVYDLKPSRIFVIAPVILQGAMTNLEKDFDKSITQKFEYLWFAQDDEKKDNGEVVPGIGGSVYELLGIGDSSSKNSFIPELVKFRRKALKAGRMG